jgi:hypothetical protein
VKGDSDVLYYGTLVLDWWYVVRHYSTPEKARQDFTKVNEHAARLGGRAMIAGYRLLDDLPEEGGEPRLIVILGSREKSVRKAACLMGGQPFAMHRMNVKALIARRLRFMVNAKELEVPPGVYTSNFGKSGIRLNESGEVVPRDP